LNRNRSISTALAAAATAALGAGLGAGLAQAMSAGAATTPVPKYVVLNCSESPVAQPANWTPFCADYGVVLKNMHWTSWTSHLASGYGTVSEDDNYPSHAEGKIYTVPVLVTLWGSATVESHPGDGTYTEMTLIFPGQRPAVYEKVNGKWTATYPQTQAFGF
jgi:hypothetical protein